ncbi:MAG: hypothetical protein ACSLFQ_20570 [Thermoanaerobaculia bacterium]
MNPRLGIVVVYVVPEGSSRLLEIHLERIARHTSAQYSIYGCGVRMSASDRALLGSRPEVTLVDIPPTEMRGSDEHSYYLERLIEAAKAGGATHIVTLHLDSFPVRDRWDGELLERLSPHCVFASLAGINTACLLFSREFHDLHRPTLLVSAVEAASDGYQAYLASQKPNLHSGIGYGWVAWRQGLGWHVIEETTAKDGAARGAEVYGDAVLHLIGAVRYASPPPPAMSGGLRALGNARLETVFRVARALVPARIRLAIRARFKGTLEAVIDDSRVRRETERMEEGRVRLYADPDAYIERLRGLSPRIP